MCPTGAKYSPDFTWDALVKAGKVTLIPETLVRRLEADAKTGRIARVIELHQDLLHMVEHIIFDWGGYGGVITCHRMIGASIAIVTLRTERIGSSSTQV